MLGLPGLPARPRRVRPLSRYEYAHMVEFGWFANQQIELLRGTLVDMNSHRWPHAAAIEFLTEQLILQPVGRYSVRPQMPFFADDWSEPAPDLAVAEKDPMLRDHPSELLLVIEVADESLAIDRGPKLTIYAEAGVPEYWILDLAHRTVEVYTQPVNSRYANVQVLRDGDVLRPTLLPDVAIRVADIPRYTGTR
ncbi:MAG TPA: Uma2 family endonuclease [Kofleriaceae bacterium]|nr:Uma2 family endonuclease [Kofleriaceae bacterium]